ncbi:Maf-like protein yhdE [Raoultella planticola]|uniref:Maf-like protein yhdE n=1 Tax=Raoultella planticola TaxID=575 RepID=A0A485CK43_RAOPL|nr:Maf-like protein yhdE [Raoultella planticola]
MTTLYLASGSPRRQELLTQLGLSFERLVPGIEERRLPQESAGIMLRVWRVKKRRRGSHWPRAICRCWGPIPLLS